MRQYNEEVDNRIIEILHKNGEITFGKLKKDVEVCLQHTISFETYSNRLNAMIEHSINQSRYAIQPILQKRDEGRGKNVSYSLTKNAKIRCDLKLPIMKVEESIEKAYRLLFYYIIFFHTQTRKLKDEATYNAFLEKLRISKTELEYQGRNVVKDKDGKHNLFEYINWIHAQSKIRFIQKHYLEGSENEGKYEYFFMLPGISPSEFKKIREPGLVYHELYFTKDEVIQYFALLEKCNLIKKLQSYHLIILNEERYTIVDDSLTDILLECWTLYSHVTMYLSYKWQGICRPLDEEKVWYEHLWGKSRGNKWFVYCNNRRSEYKRTASQGEKIHTQERISYEKTEIIKKFESINNNHVKTINDYSYFIDPLLNVVYPEFLRKEFNQ